jgi:transcriptional regulator with XRE-family HTH domain
MAKRRRKRRYVTIKTTFGDNVRALRREAGLTREQLAKRAHVGLSALQYVEKGVTRNPKMDTAIKLAKALNVRVGVLCGVEQPEI